MTANPILLQKKYTRVVDLFSQKTRLPLADALSFFYHSDLYTLLHEGISDMHCRSDEYLAEELCLEYSEQTGVTQEDHCEAIETEQ